MNCPVCNKGGLAVNEKTCPQCESNLTIFNDIEKLRLIYFKQERRKVYSTVLLVVLIFIIIILFYVNIKPTNYQSNNVIITKNSADTIIKSESLIDNNIVIKHKLRKGETLQSVVNFFDGKITVKDLIKENNIKAPRRIRVGKEIRVKLLKE